MRCYDCGAYTPYTITDRVGQCSVKGRMAHGSSHACDKWQRPIKSVCSVCHGYYDENGLTGEIWTDEPGVSHGYCPSCLEKTLAEEEK